MTKKSTALYGLALATTVACSSDNKSFDDKARKAALSASSAPASGDASGAGAADGSDHAHAGAPKPAPRKPIVDKANTAAPVTSSNPQPTTTATISPTPEATASATPSPSPSPTGSPAANPAVRGQLKLVPNVKNATGGEIWEFTVPAGAAALPWNTDATKFELKLGETLRIKAAEAGHGFHTGGSPCPHGGDRQYDNGAMVNRNSTGQIALTGYFECDIKAAIDTTGTNANAVYDHTKGTGARIFLIAK